jgi:hypothetical protein
MNADLNTGFICEGGGLTFESPGAYGCIYSGNEADFIFPQTSQISADKYRNEIGVDQRNLRESIFGYDFFRRKYIITLIPYLYAIRYGNTFCSETREA